jgi:hypothetical protein
MTYLLDSNTFIQSANAFYNFDVVPGFWTWIEKANKEGFLYSVHAVQKELVAYQDRLAMWAKDKGGGFFLRPSKKVLAALPRVSKWVYENTNYGEAAKNAFFSKADFYLVGHALACDATVVTFEKHPQATAIVKIPAVCAGLNVPCIDLFALLKEKKAKFI